MNGFSRTAALLSAMLLGALLPGARAGVWLVGWLVPTMLFLVFLETRLGRSALTPRHLALLAANLAVGLAAWGAGRLGAGPEVAQAAFFCGIAPTAIAAPVIISFLGGDVAFVVGSFLLTNLAVAALLPALLPFVLGRPTPEEFAQVTGSVAVVVFAPFVAAWLLRTLHPPAAAWPARWRNVSFGLWNVSIFLITASASHFIREQTTAPVTLILQLAGASLAVCALNFALGRVLGGGSHAREASQALGQKNTTFTLYLALAHAGPLVALGPTFYVIWHNLWNSWQLHRAGRGAGPRTGAGR